MPTISMFYGIVIYLYFFDNEKYNLPHVHARYQGQNASFSISGGELLSGDLPAIPAHTRCYTKIAIPAPCATPWANAKRPRACWVGAAIR